MNFTNFTRYSGFFGAVIAATVLLVTTGDIVTAGGIIAASLTSVTPAK